jgi:L-ascorbate metabolism protein UlaG (beta-lactamase superfamily)
MISGSQQRIRVTYVGHATLLIEIGTVRVLTDPNWDRSLGGFLKRVSDPGIAFDALPPLDAILLTHAHADHLSFATLRTLPQSVPVLAPPAVAQWLRRRGFVQAAAIAPGESLPIGDVRLSAAPAKHAGARYAVDRWRRAANMYLLDTNNLSCFFAGDTALTREVHHLITRVLHEAGRPLDLALLPIGHAPWWKPGFRRGHLTARDALELFEELEARVFVPYHWGTFNHVTSTAFDGIRRLRSQLEHHPRASDVRILEPGESLVLVANQ